MMVVLREAHDEAKAGLGVGVELASAELKDVAEAFRRTVLAVYAVVGSWVADVGEGEGDFVVNLLHGREDELTKSILLFVNCQYALHLGKWLSVCRTRVSGHLLMMCASNGT